MSTSVAESPAQNEAVARTLANLESQTPQDQVIFLAQCDRQMHDGSVDYAIMEDANLSLAARLMGLNSFLHNREVSEDLQATWYGYQTFLWQHGGARSTIVPDSEITELGESGLWVTRDEMHTVVDFGMPIAWADSRTQHSSLRLLSKKEGIHYDAYVDLHENDHQCGTDRTPHDAVALLRQVHRFSARGGAEYGEMIGDLIPLADEIYYTVASEAVKQNDWYGLAEVVIGPDIDSSMRKLIYARAPEGASRNELIAIQREANREVINYIERLYNASHKVADMFSPVANRAAYVDAFLRGTLTFIHGLSQHEQNQRHTRDTIDLSDEYSLSVRLDDDEPLTLLDELIEAIDEMHSLRFDKDTVLTSGPRSWDYRTYRYSSIDADKGVRSQLLEYVRPRPGARGDRSIEFGRPRSGITASFDLRFTKSPFITDGKSGHDNESLSIRTDFDADESEGYVVSLDIGSIMGSGNNLGVRIGRFLAWSNQLRFRHVLNERPLFNHSSEVLGFAGEEEIASTLGMVIAERQRDPRLMNFADLNRILAAAHVIDYDTDC